MCLAIKYKAEYSSRKGYKLLHKREGKYYTGMCDYPKVRILKSRYVRDLNHTDIKGDGFYYSPGFHICVSLEQAYYLKAAQERYHANSSLVICEVVFREQVAYGKVNWHYTGVETFGCKTVVAKECRIVREVQDG